MPPKGKAKNGVKSKAKPYQLCDSITEGSRVKDIFKKEWVIGKPVGTGGFGRLYQAADFSGSTGSDYVIKIEPNDNGPLFSELKFYQRKAKESMVKEYMSKHKLKKLGVPWYISSGQHDIDKTKLRFMVIPRYSTDLQKLFMQCGKKFPLKTVLTIALQVLDSLEYIHSGTEAYVHTDIKAANLLLGLHDPNQVYLVDFGLAAKYENEGTHKEYKADPRKAHNGTIEFTSRDAHRGCEPSRRGDLEILGYCCIQWLCSELPWETCLNQPEKVKSLKEQFMDDLPNSLEKLSHDIPKCLIHYMEYVGQLSYEDQPDYSQLRKYFKEEFKKSKLKCDGILEFPAESKPTPSRKRKSTSPAAEAKRKKGAAIPSTSKETAAEKKTTTRRKVTAAARAKKSTTKPVDTVEDSSSTSLSLNKNNSSSRKSLDPRAVKALKKAITVKGRGKGASAPAPTGSKGNLALQHCITPQAATTLRRQRGTQKSVASTSKPAGRSPRVTQLSITTVSTQTSPGLQGLKAMKRTRKVRKN